MAEFVLVETYVEHSYHDNYLMGVYFDGWITRHESLGYGNGILNGGYADAPSEVIERYRRVKSLRRSLLILLISVSPTTRLTLYKLDPLGKLKNAD